MINSRLAVAALIAVLIAFPTVAGAAKNGTYVGKDEGQVKVTLKIKNNRVVKFEGNPGGSCYGSYMLVAFKYPSKSKRPKADNRVNKKGLFTLTFKGNPDVSFKDDQRTLLGKVKGNKVTGRMLVSGLCSVDAKFTAVRK